MRNLLFGLIICTLIGTQAIASGAFNEYSLAKETEIGQRTSDIFERRLHIVHSLVIDAYFRDMVAKLAEHMKSPFSYSVVVFEGGIPESCRGVPLVMPPDYMRTDVREPISVAGGTVFVPLPLLADAPREEWLVFEVAHAMAHVASRHAARLESQMDVVRMLEVNPISPDPTVSHEVIVSSSRRFERDADAASVHIMSDAGYDPNRCLPLSDLSKRDSESLFPSLRVNTGRREDTLEKIITGLPQRDYVPSRTTFLEAKEVAARCLQASSRQQ